MPLRPIPTLDLYPAEHRVEIDALNARIYETVNNGVYRAGFATTQQAYEEAVYPLFATLDELETRLSNRRYLFGVDAAGNRLAAFRDAGALRCRVPRALQMQPAPHSRLSESLRLPARPLPGARRGGNGRTSTTSSATITTRTTTSTPRASCPLARSRIWPLCMVGKI